MTHTHTQTRTLQKLFNQNLWVKDNYDLSQHRNLTVVGTMPKDPFGQNKGELIYRPRQSSKPHNHRKDLMSTPKPLRDLYNIAAEDMRKNGQNPDEFYMYALYHSGMVKPDDSLRAAFWHFDLMRLNRIGKHSGKMPVAIGYASTSTLPALFLTKLMKENLCSTARQSIGDQANHENMAKTALLGGYVFRPQPYDIVRYDNLTMHRSAPNDTGEDVFREFAHIAFSPVP